MQYRVQGKSFFGVTVFVNVITESSNRGINKGRWMMHAIAPGMLLSFSFEPDLSHASILYYYLF
jgi:hypothetical protein